MLQISENAYSMKNLNGAALSINTALENVLNIAQNQAQNVLNNKFKPQFWCFANLTFIQFWEICKNLNAFIFPLKFTSSNKFCTLWMFLLFSVFYYLFIYLYFVNWLVEFSKCDE